MNWVKKMDKRVQLMTSVCTGAAVLASSGVLDGKPAATNHAAFAWVTSFGPHVFWDNVSRWVDAGHYVTSAGVSAGTDMAFHLVDRLMGRAVAETSVKQAEYDWHRDPQQPIFIHKAPSFRLRERTELKRPRFPTAAGDAAPKTHSAANAAPRDSIFRVRRHSF